MRALPDGRTELRRRIASACVLAAAALATAWIGGIPLAAFWSAAALGVAVEWLRLTRGAGLAWRLAGVVYAGAVALAPIVLRADPVWGFAALLWLFAVVWITDIMALVCGRGIGGPKLWPRISPKKTWAGFVGGSACGAIGGAVVGATAGAPTLGPVVLLSALGAVSTQAGDLLESWLKRRFGVKDTGGLIPGHGGLMDRLDGFAVAAAFALLVAVARGGWSRAGEGLLVW